MDFKSAGKTPDAAQAEHMHQTQLSCYAVLYRDATGKKESGLELHHLVKLKAPKVVITAFPPMSNQQEARLYRSIESYQEGLMRRDFVPSVGFQCSACEYMTECRKWDGKVPNA